MVKLENIEELGNPKIRRHHDVASGKWYFSVVDLIDLTTSSKNPRNYWKVLKNRLKKSTKKEESELVTKFNQLKMKAKDGKYYKTDAADAETLTEIIKLIPGADVNSLAACFEPFIDPSTPPISTPKEEAALIEKEEEYDAELLVDAYEKDAYIYIEAMTGGIPPENLKISLTKNKIKILGKRETPKEIHPKDYFSKEIYWVSFGRDISLPHPVNTENMSVREDRGHIIIKLEKI